MATTRKRMAVWVGLVTLAGLATFAGRKYFLGWSGPTSASSNSIMVIAPYDYEGSWVFDDRAAGLIREPFVGGVPEMIDALVKDIPDAKLGFRLLFSSHEFPGFQKKLTWLRGDKGGNYYELDEPKMEGWLCPALFKYYSEPPKTIYVKAEPRRRQA